MTTDTPTLISAMRVLANDIQSEDGVANAAIAEAADRLGEMQAEAERLRGLLSDQQKWMDYISSERDSFEQERDQYRAEAQSLREEMEQLEAEKAKYIGKHAAQFQMRKSAEQERDQLKAAVALAIDTFEQYQMDVDTYPPVKHVAVMQSLNGVLAKHDAEVIDRACAHVDDITYGHKVTQWFRGYANQLRQQAKEVQS